jgi:pSer/pThr/pTyr-binding forkhead associated (FHA) protein
VICITCGRDNANHLVFCQECGQRLAGRAAPATPVIGLSGPAHASHAPPPAPAMEARGSQAPRPPSLVPQRPPAPEVNFAAPAEAHKGDGESASGSDGSGAETMPCPLCGHRNPRSLRFCVTCGHLLAPPSQAPSLPFAATTLAPAVRRDKGSSVPPAAPRDAVVQTIRPPAPDAHPVTTQSPIAPARVVDLGAPASEAMLRLCPRCRGGNDPTSQFCRFCGASISDAPSIALAPRTPPPPAPALAATVESSAYVPPTPVPPGPMLPSPTPVRSTVAMVSPASGPAARARLVLIARDGGEGPGYPLGESVDIGRSEGNILLGDDRYVSPRHARIQVRGGAYYLRDLASTNGVYVRIPFGQALQGAGLSSRGRPEGASSGAALEHPLVDQDLFLVGQQVLKFEVVKHAEEGFGVASENGTLVFGTPAAPRYARLSQRTVEGVVRDVYHLQKAETIIGREVGDLVFTEDPFLSRRHAAVVVQGAALGPKGQQRRFSLMDLGSSNGTFLQLREEIRLKNGDHLRIGQQLFRFDLDRTDA